MPADEQGDIEAKLRRLEELEAADEARAHGLPDSVPDAKLRAVLELNGFNTVRAQILSACRTVGAIPLEAIDAGLIYNDEARARLKVDPNPAALDALAIAEAEVRYLKIVRRWRRELGELEERLAATARIVQP